MRSSPTLASAGGEQLRSESVKHSALKSVAGFLTTGGGTIFIGVGDAGEVLGLRPDLEILAQGRQNVDQLINNIRTDVAQRFRDRDTINDYLTITPVAIQDAQVLQLEVASRRTLSFMSSPGDDYQLFRRQGNRTTTVKVYEVQEFQAWRNVNVLPVTPTSTSAPHPVRRSTRNAAGLKPAAPDPHGPLTVAEPAATFLQQNPRAARPASCASLPHVSS